jgi:pyridoxamine 5'-phosphate oxidase
LQSETLDARETFDARLAEATARFEGGEVPRPPRWTGFRVLPRRIEFWYGAQYRLHERHAHECADDGTWSTRMLYP